jgi:hypothetical protein
MPPKMQELEQAAQPSGENTTIGLQYDRYINNTLTRVLLDNPTIQTLPRRGPGRPRVNKAPEQKRAEAAERARKYRNRKREKKAVRSLGTQQLPGTRQLSAIKEQLVAGLGPVIPAML